jgi:hypothetical protein
MRKVAIALVRSEAVDTMEAIVDGSALSALTRCAALSDQMPVARAKGVSALVGSRGPRRREWRRSGRSPSQFAKVERTLAMRMQSAH